MCACVRVKYFFFISVFATFDMLVRQSFRFRYNVLKRKQKILVYRNERIGQKKKKKTLTHILR